MKDIATSCIFLINYISLDRAAYQRSDVNALGITVMVSWKTHTLLMSSRAHLPFLDQGRVVLDAIERASEEDIERVVGPYLTHLRSRRIFSYIAQVPIR